MTTEAADLETAADRRREALARRERASLVRQTVSPNFVLLVTATIGAFAWLAVDPTAPRLLTFVSVALAWIVAVCLHEYGHARAAFAGGDVSVGKRGYLTLDPIRFIDPVFTFGFPMLAASLGGIGLPGAAVFISTGKLRNRYWRAAAALAGPLATFVILALLATPFVLGWDFGLNDAFWNALAFLAYLQATAVLLNLLPVPGLDGFAAVAAFLPSKIAKVARSNGLTILVTLFFVLMLIPGAGAGLFRTMAAFSESMGIPLERVVRGYDAFRFWQKGA